MMVVAVAVGRQGEAGVKPQPPVMRSERLLAQWLKLVDIGRHGRIRPGQFLDNLFCQGVGVRVLVEDGDDGSE